MREEVKRYVTNQGTIIKSWVMEWTEKGQQYIREDMELLKVEVQNMRKQVIPSDREDWSTGLEGGWVIREESASMRRKTADRENEKVRDLDKDRAQMAMRVEDLERLVRELERRQRETHTSEWHLETIVFQQRQKLERLEQRLEMRAVRSKEECNIYMMEACEKRASGEKQNHEKLPATKSPLVQKVKYAELEAQIMEKDKIIKETKLRLREKDQMLKEMELRLQEKDQTLRETELRMQEKERISKRENDMIRMEMAEYKHMMIEKMEMFDQKVKDAHAALITEMEKHLATRSLMASTSTKVENETTDGEGQSSMSCRTTSNCSKRRNGKNRKMADRRRAKTRSPAESNEESAKIKTQRSDTSANSDVSSIGSAKSRSSSEKSVVALAASELLDHNRLKTHISLDKTSECSTASLAGANLQAGKGKKAKSWKRAFDGFFKKKTK